MIYPLDPAWTVGNLIIRLFTEDHILQVRNVLLFPGVFFPNHDL